jgi:hypothetical protein
MKNSHESSSVTTFQGDLTAKPRTWLLTERVPRNFMTMAYWCQQTSVAILSIAGNTSFSEFNIAPTLNTFTSAADLTGIFDQYCIESVSISATVKYLNPGFIAYGLLLTALDFDNVTNLGAATAIEQYSNCLVTELASGQSIQRALRPCVAPAIYTTTSVAFSGYGVARMWVDAADPNVPHYGYRSAYSNPTGTNNPFEIQYTITAILGFRNKH